MVSLDDILPTGQSDGALYLALEWHFLHSPLSHLSHEGGARPEAGQLPVKQFPFAPTQPVDPFFAFLSCECLCFSQFPPTNPVQLPSLTHQN